MTVYHGSSHLLEMNMVGRVVCLLKLKLDFECCLLL